MKDKGKEVVLEFLHWFWHSYIDLQGPGGNEKRQGVHTRDIKTVSEEKMAEQRRRCKTKYRTWK